MARQAKTGFGQRVVKLLGPRLKALDFRRHESSRVLYDGETRRGLVEYALWVYHRDQTRFHIQWGLRHRCSWAIYGYIDEFSREEYLGVFEWTSEADIDTQLLHSLDVWQRERYAKIPQMESLLRYSREGKDSLLMWHEWWKEFEHLSLLHADLKRFIAVFPDLMVDEIQASWQFCEEIFSVSQQGFPMTWKCFLLLKQRKLMGDAFTGSWWQVHGLSLDAVFFYKHLGDLDALLEPYDI